MGIPGSANLLLAAGEAQAYQLEQSLRFTDEASAYLLLNGGVTPTNGKIATHSVWVKRSLAETSDITVYGSSPASTLWNDIKFDGNDRLIYRQYHSSGGAALWALTTAARYRDPSAWLHIVVAIDTTQSTSSDRVKMYVNGAQITAWDQESYPGQNQEPLGQQGSYGAGIGRLATQFSNYFDGYMAEYHHVDGVAHDPTDFGEYDDNGVWRPIEVTGITYGNRGWYLTFDPTATNGIGHDHSGSGNHFTANNFTTSGTETDVMSDTPTNNFATFNPLQVPNGGSPTFSEGNLYYDLNNSGSTISTIGVKSGKWYCEIKAEGTMSQRPIIGLNYLNPTSQGDAGNQVWPGHDVAYAYNGDKWVNYSNSSYGTSWSNGDIIGIALDLDSATQTVTFYRNGTSQGAINLPASGKTWHVSVSSYGADGDNLAFTANFGQRAFEQTQPTGYKSWCTANLPAPDIADGSDYFDTFLYNGTNSSSASNKTGDFAWTPDFVWIKNRNGANSHRLVDVVRGTGKSLISNSSGAEVNSTTFAPTAFISGGFTTETSDNSINGTTSDTYVAWNWLAGGSGSSNTAGSITSTVSANPSAGFSIVTWLGNATNGSVGHGLGVAPKLLIVKDTTNGYNWYVFTTATGTNLRFEGLNTTSAATTQASQFTASSTVVSNLTTSASLNTNGATMLMYCFAEVEGYSKFGSYEGNNTDNNNAFVYLGFTPAFLMIKNADSASNWIIHDTTRDTYNFSDTDLYPNTSGTEASDNYMDFLSNGFKIRDTSGPSGNSNTYIYAAFASNPFGGDGVTPATAR